MRFRYIFMSIGLALVLFASVMTSPDSGFLSGLPFGAEEISRMLSISRGLTLLLFIHYSRKALHDYPAADAESLFQKAGESPIGSGLALIALAIVTLAMTLLFSSSARAQEVPKQALQYLSTLKAEQVKYWPTHPAPQQLGGLVDHESACPLRSCWNPSARLKTQREEGAGFGQITRAYRKDGSLRFDALSEIRAGHSDLAEWSWSNVYVRPDLQLRAMVLKSKDNFTALAAVKDRMERLNFADAAYNGGIGGVQNERRACGLSTGCDPQQWFGHVERYCLKSKTVIYGQRSACDINRHHVRDVILTRSLKYIWWLA